MTAGTIAAALRRFESVIRRRPKSALQNDSVARSHWDGGLRVVTDNENGVQIVTEMPPLLGGSGEGVTPGWLLRAGLASCVATRIVMAAVSEGIALDSLEVRASSRSDARGLFGLTDAHGETVSAAPLDAQLQVRIGASEVAAARLRSLVEQSQEYSPVSCALQQAVPLRLQIEVVSAEPGD